MFSCCASSASSPRANASGSSIEVPSFTLGFIPVFALRNIFPHRCAPYVCRRNSAPRRKTAHAVAARCFSPNPYAPRPGKPYGPLSYDGLRRRSVAACASYAAWTVAAGKPAGWRTQAASYTAAVYARRQKNAYSLQNSARPSSWALRQRVDAPVFHWRAVPLQLTYFIGRRTQITRNTAGGARGEAVCSPPHPAGSPVFCRRALTHASLSARSFSRLRACVRSYPQGCLSARFCPSGVSAAPRLRRAFQLRFRPYIRPLSSIRPQSPAVNRCFRASFCPQRTARPAIPSREPSHITASPARPKHKIHCN